MEEIESAGVMAEEEDATNAEDEIEIGNTYINILKALFSRYIFMLIKHEIISQFIFLQIFSGMDVADRYGWINMVHQQEPTTE